MPGSYELGESSSSPSVISTLQNFCFQRAKLNQPSALQAANCSSSSLQLVKASSSESTPDSQQVTFVPETPEAERVCSSSNSRDSQNHALSSREGSSSPIPSFHRKIIKSNVKRFLESKSLTPLLTESTSEISQKTAMDEYELFCEKEHCLREFLKHNPSADIMEAQDILVSSMWDLPKALEQAKGKVFLKNKKKAISAGPSVQKGVMFGANVAVNGKVISPSTPEIVLDSDDDSIVPVKTGFSVSSTSSPIPTKKGQSVSKKRRRVICIEDSDDDSFVSHQDVHSTNQQPVHNSEFSVLDYQPPSSGLLLQQVPNSSSTTEHSAVTCSKLMPQQAINSTVNDTVSTHDVSETLLGPKGKNKKVGKNQSKLKTVKKKRRKCDSDDDDDMAEEYGNEDVYDSEDSDAGENLTPARSGVLSFFQDGTINELLTIPGCSKKKVEIIVKSRPFDSWIDLVHKVSTDKYLSGDLLNKAKKVLDMRTAVNKLMHKCQRISLEMGDLVENLKQNKEHCRDYVAKQPDCLNPNMHLAAYQMLGLNWLLLMHNQEVNGILADEMGLGKTVQAIAFLAYLHEQNKPGPHLIVVPSSTLDNWQNEFQTWWPSASLLRYHGSQESRRELRLQIINDELEEFDVMVTTYNMVASSAEDRSFFKKLDFHYVIFDEAHMLKNMASQRYQNLMRVKASRRLLLTGTPLQNNLVELMSLLIFAMPNMFSGKTEQIKLMFSTVCKSDDGKTKFERERIEHAKRIMKPFVLRRLKKEVLKDLPAKHEEIRLCQMTGSQHKQYTDLVAVLSEEVRKNAETEVTTSGAGMMMQLRKAANHPLLLRHCYDDAKLLKMAKRMLKEPTHAEANANFIFEDMAVMSDFELHRLCKQYSSLKSYLLTDGEILNSGKFAVLDSLLPDMIEKGHRILLFSQFTMVLDIIESYMQIRKHEYLRLDGQVPVSERQQLIDEFNQNRSIHMFLLSTRAGGLGINLTSADTVLIHDIDFNPYNDKQAEDRCHRVGQANDVTVIRMISEDSIEEGMLQRAKEKLRLERDVTAVNEDEEKDSTSVATLLRDALGVSHSKS